MMTKIAAPSILTLLLTVAAAAPPAAAQTTGRAYVGSSFGSLSVNADAVNDSSIAFGFSGGAALSDFIDVELDVVLPSQTLTRSHSGPSVSFAPPGSSVAERDRLAVITRFDTARDISTSISGVVIFHPRRGRVTPGVIVGVVNQHLRDTRTYTPLSIPEGVDPLNPAVAAHRESASRNIGGPTFGAQVAVAVSRHLEVVPDIRYDYGSIGDEINNTLRSSIRIRWWF